MIAHENKQAQQNNSVTKFNKILIACSKQL